MEVRKLEEESLFEVESEKRPSEFYVVDLQAKSCTCPHFRFRGAFCKHLQAVKESQKDKAPRIADYSELY